MPNEQKWIREYELVFAWPSGSLAITSVDQRDPLDIAFEITYDPKNLGQGTMDLRIFGLKESNVAQLTQLGVKVFLSVGYKNYPLARIFTGDLRKLTVDSDNNKHVTKMIFITSRIGSKPFIRTFPSAVTHAERIKSMISEMRKDIPELITDIAIKEVDNLVNSEPSATELGQKNLSDRTLLTDLVDGPLTTQDTALEEIKEYLKTFSIEVTTQNDVLYLIRKGGTFPFKSPVQAELGANLISPPRRRLDNLEAATGSSEANIIWELNMLLEPSIAPNTVVVSSHVRNDAGTVEERTIILKAVEVKHSGKFRGNQWYTAISGTIDSSYLTEGPVSSVANEIKIPYREPDYVTPERTRPVFRSRGASGNF